MWFEAGIELLVSALPEPPGFLPKAEGATSSQRPQGTIAGEDLVVKASAWQGDILGPGDPDDISKTTLLTVIYTRTTLSRWKTVIPCKDAATI